MSDPIDWARLPLATLQQDIDVRQHVTRWVTLHQRAGHRIIRRLDGGEAVFEAFVRRPRTLSIGQFEVPDIDTQLARLSRTDGVRPWRPSSVREALGVPAIFRAASLIATVTGSLSMRGLRDEVEVAPQDRPRIIIRPNPKQTPRDFYRDTAWNLARYGEAWWFVAKRDSDGLASALFNVPSPVEVSVEASDDPLAPHITWRGKSTRDGTLKRDDLRQITLLMDDDGRGLGPLQSCGAAVSVAVEAQEWAANFYAAGGYPNIWIKAAGSLSGDEDDWSTTDQTDAGATSEAERLKLEWISTAPNTPKVTDEGILDVKQFDPNPQGAQMLDARDYQNGDAARMYGIPGTILDFYRSGASLTYQNLDDEFIKWVRLGLRPGYLEPIEQAMSDLLTRSTVARFKTEQLEAPNLNSRFEVYEKAVTVFGREEGADYARKREGLVRGDIENAPVPFASTPITTIPRAASREVRCPNCRKLVARALGPGSEVECGRCKTLVMVA